MSSIVKPSRYEMAEQFVRDAITASDMAYERCRGRSPGHYRDQEIRAMGIFAKLQARARAFSKDRTDFQTQVESDQTGLMQLELFS